MYITLSKFGTTLTSRQLGKEAYSAFKPSLNDTSKDEIIEVDFEGVNTFSPSWGDEFITPLIKEYNERVVLRKSDNPSVIETLKLLEEINKTKFKFKEN